MWRSMGTVVTKRRELSLIASGLIEFRMLSLCYMWLWHNTINMGKLSYKFVSGGSTCGCSRDGVVRSQWPAVRVQPTMLCVSSHMHTPEYFLSLRPRQNGRHLPDEDIFKCIFLNENVWISLKISLKFVPRVPINNIPAMVLIMAWRRPGDKPLSEPMMVSLPAHICVTRPQWVQCPSHLRINISFKYIIQHFRGVIAGNRNLFCDHLSAPNMR